MNFIDLDSRESKFERDRAKRLEAAKKKQEQEDRKRREHETRQKELEELAFLNKLKREEELERQEELQRLENELTGGINCSGALTLVVDSSGSEDDRIILPQSFFDKLNTQDAFSRGISYFRVVARSSEKITHCGVREFTAPEGTVIAPQKVIDSIFGAETSDLGVFVKYVRLPKVTLVKFQPVENRFYGLEDVKLILEENMRHHSALTLGDVVTIWHRGKKYLLKVTHILPEAQGSLIDTNVEVDFEESVEHKAHQSTSEATNSQVQGGHILGSSNSSIVGTSNQTASALPSAAPVSIHSPVSIPEEPVASGDAVQYKFRIQGKNLSRRFLKTDPVANLFEYLRYIALSSDSGPLRSLCDQGKTLQLTSRFPTRVIVEGSPELASGRTIEEYGLCSPIDFFVGNSSS